MGEGNHDTVEEHRTTDGADRSTGTGGDTVTDGEGVTSGESGRAVGATGVDPDDIDRLLGTASESGDEGGSIPPDDRFDVMKNERRRRVLDYLRRRESTATTSEVAEHVASIENEKDPELLTAQERKRVYIGLYQCHLPRMDDMDVIDFDKDRGVLELGPRAPPLFEYLEDPADPKLHLARRYLVASGVGIAVLSVAVAFASGTSPVTLALHGVVVATLGSMTLVDAIGVDTPN